MKVSLQLFNFKGDWIINPITPFSKRWKIWLMKLGALQKGFHFGKIFKPICNREKIIIEGKYTVFFRVQKKTREKYINTFWVISAYLYTPQCCHIWPPDVRPKHGAILKHHTEQNPPQQLRCPSGTFCIPNNWKVAEISHQHSLPIHLVRYPEGKCVEFGNKYSNF